MSWLRRRRSTAAGAPSSDDRLHPTFRDEELERRFERDGYVAARLLDEEGIEAVRELRRRLGPAPGDPASGLFNDTWSTDSGYKREVIDGLTDLVAPRLAELLVDHRPLGIVHIVKWPGDEGRVVAHRDPTFVDETSHRSLGVWCTLGDLGSDEGPLRVIPGSHRLPSGVRVHQSPDNLYPEVDSAIDELSVPVPLGPGEALLYDHRLLHLSEANRTERERVVVGGIIVPAGVQAIYAVQTPRGARCVRIEPGFFSEHRLDRLDVDRVLATCPDLGPVAESSKRIGLEELRALRR